MDALSDMLSPYLENPWIQSLGIFILSLVLTVVARWTLRFVFIGVAQKTKTEVDNILLRTVKNVVTYSIPVIGLMVALTPLALQTPIPERILFSFLVVLLMRAAINLFDDMSEWLEKTWLERTASTLDHCPTFGLRRSFISCRSQAACHSAYHRFLATRRPFRWKTYRLPRTGAISLRAAGDTRPRRATEAQQLLYIRRGAARQGLVRHPWREFPVGHEPAPSDDDHRGRYVLARDRRRRGGDGHASG